MPAEILDAIVEEPGSEPAATVQALVDDAAIPKRGAAWQSLADDRWGLLGTLFFVTAVLGLPLLWKSRAFSPWAKWLLSLVVIAYTGLLFWLVGLVMQWSYHRVVESL